MLLVPLCVALAAAPTGFTAASRGLSVTGISPDRAEFYSEYLAQQLVAGGLKVVTPKEVAALLGMERQRQLMGCTDSGACVAEIAAALGTDGLVQGEVARLESGGYQVSLKVLWSRDGRPLALFTGRAADEPGLLDVMGKGAALIAKDLTGSDWARFIQAPSTHAIVPATPMRVITWLPAVAGALALGVGIFSSVRAGADARALKSGTFLDAEAVAVAREGATLQTVGAVMFAVAGVGVAATAALFFLGGSDARPQLAVWPGGASLGVAGVLP